MPLKFKVKKEEMDFGNMDDFDPNVIDQFGYFAVGVIIVFAGIITGLSLYIMNT